MNNIFLLHLILYLKLSYNHVLSNIYICSSKSSCGCTKNITISSRIVGGELATDQAWGWAVSLRSSSTNRHFCGGTIISSTHILTAAHCTSMKNSNSILVYFGSVNLNLPGQTRGVSKIYEHPHYSSITYLNDIAIIKLSSPLNLNQVGMNRVCLPNVSSNTLGEEYPQANTDLVAIGWGTLSENSQNISPLLRQVTLKSIPANSRYCQNSKLANPSTQLCAGAIPDGGKDTCQGDSGGPLLMFTSNHVWEQIGITSFGYGCAKPSFPGIYTRVAAYQSWIKTTLNESNSIFVLSYSIFIPFLLLFIL